MVKMGWIPSEEEYNPEITKEQWIISSNPEIFDAVSAFNELGIVDWKQSQKANFSVGDIVYIYISHEEQQIKLKTEVLKINIPTNEIIDDSKFYLNKDMLEPASNFMKLKLIKNIKGSAFTKEALELFDFKSPQGPIKIKGNLKEYMSFIEYLQNKAELIPTTYDASYELVTEVVKSYAKMQDLSECDYNDLDLIYLSTVGTWKHSVEKKIDSVNKSNLPQIEKERLIAYITNLWERVQAREFSHCEEESKITFGMFGTGFYTTKTKTDSFNVQKFIQMCVNLLPIEEDEVAFELVEENIASGFKGLATAGISVILHCLKPFIFPILNSNQGKNNIFEKLGLNLSKINSETTYIENSRKIKAYRDSNFNWKNYRIFDRENFENIQGDTQMAQEDTLVKKYASLLKNTKNLILTGAPGTGKTYLAKQIAKELGCKDDNIGFVQFHPSYDYTDFVEGLRPTDKDGNGNVGFERRDGVFKKFCEKAILPSSVTEDIQKELNENPTIWKVSLERTGDNPTRTDCLKNGYIRLGWSNYGDVADFSNFSGYTEVGGSVVLVAFQSKMKVGDIVLSCYSATEIDAVGIVTGDYEYRPEGGDYPRYRTVKWIVKGIKENIVEKNHGKTLTLASVYKLSVSIKDVFDIVEKYSTNQTLSSDSQEKTSNSPYVFIIDEINRGEVAKIFGELFYCVDPGYRGKEGKINTQYQNLIKENNIFHSGFFIPENVYIIGTMNDIDRSVESMDFAFRRRFSWAEVKAKDTVGMLDNELSAELAEKAKRRMENLNAAIWNEKENKGIEGLNEAYHIGASYFLKLNNYDGSQEKRFESLWEYHIKGILQEYLRGSGNEAKIAELKAAYDKEEEN